MPKVHIIFFIRTGTKYIQSNAGGREHVTVLACRNATGEMKGKTQLAPKSLDSENAPPGSSICVSVSGWIKNVLSILFHKQDDIYII